MDPEKYNELPSPLSEEFMSDASHGSLSSEFEELQPSQFPLPLLALEGENVSDLTRRMEGSTSPQLLDLVSAVQGAAPQSNASTPVFPQSQTRSSHDDMTQPQFVADLEQHAAKRTEIRVCAVCQRRRQSTFRPISKSQQHFLAFAFEDQPQQFLRYRIAPTARMCQSCSKFLYKIMNTDTRFQTTQYQNRNRLPNESASSSVTLSIGHHSQQSEGLPHRDAAARAEQASSSHSIRQGLLTFSWNRLLNGLILIHPVTHIRFTVGVLSSPWCNRHQLARKLGATGTPRSALFESYILNAAQEIVVYPPKHDENDYSGCLSHILGLDVVVVSIYAIVREMEHQIKYFLQMQKRIVIIVRLDNCADEAETSKFIHSTSESAATLGFALVPIFFVRENSTIETWHHIAQAVWTGIEVS